MKTATWAIAVVAVAVLSSPFVAVAARPMAIVGRGGAEHVAGEVLVKFRGSATGRDRRAALAKRGHAMVADLARGWLHVKARPGETVDDAVSTYLADPAVEHAQPNYVYRAFASPNDPEYVQLWGFHNTEQPSPSVLQPGASLYPTSTPVAGSDVNLEPAWAHTTDCSSVPVAVVDTGVNYQHVDLAANMWNGGVSFPLHGYDFIDGDMDPMDLNGHGTHVAGAIGARGNNAIGVTGVCWNASIMAIRVLDASGGGNTVSIVNGIDFALGHGARVINLSLGASGPFDQLLSDAITRAMNADVVVVAAAGNAAANNDGGTRVWPCNFTHPNLVCVAALDQAYALASFSNYGMTSVDVGAPGTNILSTWAGTNAVATPGSWMLDPAVGGWGFATLDDFPDYFVINPVNYFEPSPLYAAGADDRAYTFMSIPAGDVVIGEMFAVINVRSGDHFRLACRAGSGDPFDPAGTLLADFTDEATYPFIAMLVGDIPAGCSGAATFGLQLESAAGSARERGLAITGVTITGLTVNDTSYNTISGTSMAAPVVAGVAALVRAYQSPEYTAEDVVAAIVQGGRPVASLARKTTSGNAVDAMRALAHVRPPSGLTVTVR